MIPPYGKLCPACRSFFDHQHICNPEFKWGVLYSNDRVATDEDLELAWDLLFELQIPTNPDGTYTCPRWFGRLWNDVRYLESQSFVYGRRREVRHIDVVRSLLQEAVKTRGSVGP